MRLERGKEREKECASESHPVRVREKFGTCLEEGKAGDSSATSEAAALRRAAQR